mmetsp:Transcript_4874/g.18055  ORF Transcript_4874/g.18055 Transcript_4874/m.18055 type:complete len:620 (-) Transcript_4874:66-1925(-)
MMPSARRNKDPQWGVLRGGVSVNEPFSLGDDWEVKFDVSAIIGGRPHMEDRWVAARHPDSTKNIVAFGVFDGHGGDQVSSHLATNFCDVLFRDPELEQDPAAALVKCCETLDRQICQKFPKPEGKFKGPGPGSTAVVVLFVLGGNAADGRNSGGDGTHGTTGAGTARDDGTGFPRDGGDGTLNHPANAPHRSPITNGDAGNNPVPQSPITDRDGIDNTLPRSLTDTAPRLVTTTAPKVFIANVGDSRCVVADSTGAVVFETTDQRPSRADERSRIEGFGGSVRVVQGVSRTAGVLAVSRAFGNAGIKSMVKAEPAIETLRLDETHHAFVLCSDGLTDVAQSDRLAQATATCRTSSSPLLAKRRRNEGSVGAEKKRTVPAGPVGGSGYSPKQHTPTGSLNAKRRNSSLGPVVSSGTPKGSDNLISGVECADDNYWGSRRVAQSLTTLARMRHSADNVCVLVCRARRTDGGFPMSISTEIDDPAEDGLETRKTSPVVTPVKRSLTPAKTKTSTPRKTEREETPQKTEGTPRKTPTSAGPAKTPLNLFSKSATPLSRGSLKTSLSPLKTCTRRTPVGTPSSGKRKTAGGERDETETPGRKKETPGETKKTPLPKTVAKAFAS